MRDGQAGGFFCDVEDAGTGGEYLEDLVGEHKVQGGRQERSTGSPWALGPVAR